MRHFMRIGSHEVVVAEAVEVGQGEDREKERTSHRGRELISQLDQQAVEKPGNEKEQDDIEQEQDGVAGAEDAKHDGIEVRAQRAIEIREVAIQDLTFAESPRDVELATEVDEDVGPSAPTEPEHQASDTSQ